MEIKCGVRVLLGVGGCLSAPSKRPMATSCVEK